MYKKEDIKILYDENTLQDGIKSLAETLNEMYRDEDVTVIGVLKGGVMFAADLVKYLDMPVKMEFIRLSSYGSSKVSSGKVTAIDITLPDLNEKNVIIAEDIIDSGRTAQFLVNFIKTKYNVKTLKFCALLNKKIRREVDIDADYSVFEIDDKFVVGYGLDYEGYFRNLPFIGYIEHT